MIVEVVTFPLPPATDREAALALYRQSAGRWAINPDLIEKYYFLDSSTCVGGGVYLWPSREAAARWHGDEYRAMVRGLYGAEPRCEIFEALLRVDPRRGQVVEL